MNFRVLHFDSEKTWRGGEVQVFYLARELKKRNVFSPVACPPQTPLYQRCEEENIPVFPLEIKGEWDIIGALKLSRFLKREKIEILHLHSAHAHTVGWWGTKFTLPRPKIVLSRRVDFPIKKNPISRLKYREVDVIIAVSKKVKEILLRDGLKEEKIEVILSAVDLNRFSRLKDPSYLYREFNLSPEQPVVGIVAALAPHKDYWTFLRAAKIVKENMPEIKFLLVGEGELEKELKKLAKKLDLEKEVIFTGFREDVGEILSLLKVFVLSSREEGLGTSLLESMLVGVPIVATRTGGIPEIVKDGENGLLVPPKNPEKLAQGILELLKDESLRKKFIGKGKEKVKEFSVEKMVDSTIEVYQKILKK